MGDEVVEVSKKAAKKAAKASQKAERKAERSAKTAETNEITTGKLIF